MMRRSLSHTRTSCAQHGRLHATTGPGIATTPCKRWPSTLHGRTHNRLRHASGDGSTGDDTTGKQPQPPAESTTQQSKESAVATPVAEQLPGADANLQIPKEVVERLRYTVFGFDTFWVTSVDNYERDGVVFKGNVRGKDPAAAYKKMKTRMKAELGDNFQLFLLEDKEEKPTAVVLPRAAANEGTISKFTEIWLAVLFAVLTGVTTLNSNGVPLLQFLIDPFRTPITQEDLQDAVPGVLAFWFLLGAHEWGHRWAAKKHDVQLYTPFVVPAGFGLLGSFGAITRFRGFVPSRQALLSIAEAGPAVGTAASAAMVLLGCILTAGGAKDVGIESATFADSFIMAIAAQLTLGDQLGQPVVEVSSLMLAGWAGLIVNALNCIPAGELDGGRIVLGIWGRRPASLIGVLSIAALAIGSFNSALAFYWIGLVLFLQRGPVLPCEEELSQPQDESSKLLGAALLALPLLVLLPFPVELAVALKDLQEPTLF